MKKTSMESQNEVRLLTENHARDREKNLRQLFELVVNDHHREIRCFGERAEEAQKATADIENRLKTVFSQSPLFDQLVGERSLALGQFLEGSFQDFSGNFSKRLIVH